MLNIYKVHSRDCKSTLVGSVTMGGPASFVTQIWMTGDHNSLYLRIAEDNRLLQLNFNEILTAF